MKYFFVLGRETELCLAELEAVLRKKKIVNKLIGRQNDVVVYDLEKEIEAQELIDVLAGTIKIGQVVKEVKLGEPSQMAEELVNLVKIGSGKNNFGLSTYGCKIPVLRLGLEIKKRLKKGGASIRLVTGKENPLSSVIVKKNKLVDGGTEIVLVRGLNPNLRLGVSAGRTEAVQDFEFYSKIDYGRPGRDDKSGMLPPKLAQMMINLAELDKEELIYDPFCGSGTILQQALILGYTKVKGSDISEKAINDTRENLNWLKDQSLESKDMAVETFIGDARMGNNKIKDGSVGAIVTEPLLGPTLSGKEDKTKLSKIERELGELYSESLRVFQKILKAKGVAIMVIPAFVIKGQEIKIQFEYPGFKLEKVWKYARPGQNVIRYVHKFIKESAG